MKHRVHLLLSNTSHKAFFPTSFYAHCHKYTSRRLLSTKLNNTQHQKSLVNDSQSDTICIQDVKYLKDEWTNVTPKIQSLVGRNLHLQRYHPLSLIRQRIVDFMYKNFPSRTKSPLFTVLDKINPVVTVQQNFDSLLVPKDHPSRKKEDCYYINKDLLLRAHTSAHQVELIKSGLNNFLVIGDVYRRDEIDRTHYPVFHQVEGVQLCGLHDVFTDEKTASQLSLFEKVKTQRTPEKQECHSLDGVIVMQERLKSCLTKLVQHIFGQKVKTRWVETYFPFTHPSWELEIEFNGEYLEVLGCGIMEQEILKNAGAGEKMGWAFGLGLERLAMAIFKIPDIRLFWSQDSGILHQFQVEDPYSNIIYKQVSKFPPCSNDLSFWLPENGSFTTSDFHDIVRSIGGDIVEQVSLVDEFYHKKKKLWSHCYRIVYRDMSRTLTQAEVNKIHAAISEAAVANFNVVIR